MITAQGSSELPDIGALASAPAWLSVSLLLAVLFVASVPYFGPGLRDWIASRRSPPPTPPPAVTASTSTPTTPPPPPPLPEVQNRADEVSTQFIDHLLRQIQTAEKEGEAKDRDIELLRDQVQRLNQMLWQQRGPQ